MKIYTRSGDAGMTGLFSGSRVRKDDVRIRAYGDVDELNSVLGMVRAAKPPDDVTGVLRQIQNELFSLGAELATPDPKSHGTQLIDEQDITDLERAIDQFEERLAPLKQFILPAGTRAAATLHLARTVCRRAERSVVTLAHEPEEQVSDLPVRYLNRLSDLLFVLARAANAASNRADEVWEKD